MKVTNDINKAAWLVTEYTKDLLGRTIADAVSKGEIKVDRQGLAKLITIVSLTVEQGYHEANRNFEKSVIRAVEAHDSSKSSEKAKKK